MTDDPAAENPKPYAAQVALRWSDMDAYAHINNVQFLRLLEDARVIGFRDWFGGRGAGQRSLLDEGVLVSRHEIEYRRPLGFRHEPVEIQMWVSRGRRRRFRCRLHRHRPGRDGGRERRR